MTTVVASHAVSDMATWLAGGDHRKALFANFCASYRIFRHANEDRVSIVFEDADLEKMQAIINSEEGKAARAKHGVLEPIEIHIEIEGGT